MKNIKNEQGYMQNIQMFQKEILFKTMAQEYIGRSIKENEIPRNVFTKKQKSSYMLKWIFKTVRKRCTI